MNEQKRKEFGFGDIIKITKKDKSLISRYEYTTQDCLYVGNTLWGYRIPYEDILTIEKVAVNSRKELLKGWQEVEHAKDAEADGC